MKYPNFLKENDTIALVATSLASNKNPYRARLYKAINVLENKGYIIKRGKRLFRNTDLLANTDIKRGREFNRLYANENVDFIWSIGGGELMMGMLPYVNFKSIKKEKPKFFMGFSDNTNLTFTLTTIADVATIYGVSTGALAYDNLSEDAKDCLDLIEGKKLTFESYPFYNGPVTHEQERPLDILTRIPYMDENIWKSLDNKDHLMQGRMIGGCIDVLRMICGTKFDKVKKFLEKYKDDGFIWYFDNCELHSLDLQRALFQLKEAGWFKYAKGFIFSRPANPLTPYDYSFEKAMDMELGSLNLPIIYDADCSHIAPSLPFINGAIATVDYKEGKASIKYELK